MSAEDSTGKMQRSRESAQYQLSKADCFELLKIYLQEEQYWLSAHHSRASYYTGFLTTSAGGILVGIYSATSVTHFAFIAIFSAVMIYLSTNASRAIRRMYNRYLEAISMRAKIEQIMNLHSLRAASPIYWPGEGLLPKRYIDARTAFGNSSEFIQSNLRKGYQGIAEGVFNTFAILFALSAAGSIALFISGWLQLACLTTTSQ